MWVKFHPLAILLIYTNIFTASCQKSSLTYVIDNTNSMRHDIRQVKESADAITNIVFEEKSSQIQDMILVTFNDPVITLETHTDKKEDLMTHINAIETHNRYGNWDCEEPAMKGLLLGLEKSLPGSYIYLFTDASSKDFWRSHEIKNLCQKKQIQITFVLTGNCYGRQDEGFQVYYDIATACSGIAFYVNKKDVNKVLLTIKETVSGNKTVITSVKAPPSRFTDIPFVIDDQTEYAIVTASGAFVYLSITGPSAVQEKVMWINNARVIRLSDPTPGTYTARVRGQTETSVYIVGRTDFFFNHGFSVPEPKTIHDTTPQPIANTNTHLSITVTDPKHKINITSAQILNMNEEVLKNLPLRRIADDFYITDPFVAPSKRFKVVVIGKTRTGKDIRRIAKIPVTPQEPPKPKSKKPVVTISEGTRADVNYGKTIKLTCKVSAYPPPTITWKNSKKTILTSESWVVELPYEFISYLTIKDASKRDTYTCEAVNERGSESKNIELIVKDPFEISSSIKGDIMLLYGKKSTLKCDISSSEPMHIYWSFEDGKTGVSKNLVTSDKYEISADGKQLSIKNMDVDMTGKYTCKASLDKDPSKFVIYSTQVTISGITSPQILSSPSIIYTATEEKDAQLKLPCVATGQPKPVITWKLNDVIISQGAKYSIEDGALIIKNPKVSDSQMYKCQATNAAGTVYATFRVNVFQIPKVSGENTKKAVTGSSVDIECNVVKGIPKPLITWYFMGKDASTFVSVSGSDNVLRISSVEEKDAGQYKCVAHNIVGDAERITTLTVQVPPKIISKSTVVYKSVEGKDKQLKISCVATGHPKPVITWKVNEVTIVQDEKYSIVDGTLIIKNPKVSDSLTYKCQATNEAGTAYAIFQAEVRQVPKVSGTTTKRAIVGSSTNIECIVVNVVPKPTVSWQFKAKDASTFVSASGSDNVLRISNVEEKHAGQYKCVAHNVVGDAEHVTTLNVLAPPEINTPPGSSAIFKGTEDKDGLLRIPCVSTGLPKPVITWSVNEEIISKSEKYSIEDGTLIIRSPKVSDSQTYKCAATNDVGTVYASFKVEVHQIPKVSGKTSVTAVKGSSVNIQCSITKGVPKPTITWQFMAKDALRFVSVSGSDNVLRISSVEEKRAGQYKCVAHNIEGDDEHVTTLNVQVPPRIISSSSVVFNSIEGKDTTLRIPCAVTGLPKPVITWKVNGVPIYQNLKYSIEDGALVIHNPKVSDSKTYECGAVNDAGIVSAMFQANIHQVPKVSGESTKTAISGSTVTIECEVSQGAPKPTISWQFKAKDASTFVSQSGSDNVLRISKVDVKDAGQYKCVAHNVAGNAELITILTVQAPPEIKTPPGSLAVFKSTEDKDGFLKIPCVSTGLPKPVITWKLNGAIISQNEKYSIEDSTLIIRNPKVSDSQTYTCAATNVAGTVYASFKVEVHQIPKVSGKASVTAVKGSSVNIQCTIVKGEPKPTITWQFKGKDASKFVSASESDNVLRISSVEEKHAGQYKCVAHNVEGDDEHVTTLTVQAPPAIKTPAGPIPVFKSTEDKDGLLKIPCVSTGLPKPVITWEVNGEIISKNEKYSIEDGSLIIRNPKVSDSQTYTCAATNVAGTVYASFKVEVHQIPKVSGKTSVTSVKGSSVNIECTIVKGEPKPTITWQFKGKDASKFVSASGSDNVLRISSVEEKHAGQYKCVAHNVEGDAEHVSTLIVQVAPSIISSSSVVYKSVEGKDSKLKIPCAVTGLPKPLITWKVNGITIAQNDKYSIDDGVLVIKNPKVSDSHTYTCEATNEAGTVHASFQAEVHQVPRVSGDFTKKAITGTSVNIKCTVANTVPKPTITWQFMAKDASTFVSVSRSDNVLRISSVEEKHAGQYKCVAHNVAGDAEHVTTLTVQAPPKILSDISNIYKCVEESDEQLKIPCIATGIPKPVITWRLNGVNIVQNGKYTIEDGALIIKHPKVSDSDTYNCEATNEAGTVSAMIQAVIRQKPEVSGDASLKATIGASVTIECNVKKGVPKPTITWQFTKDGSEYTNLHVGNYGSDELRLWNVDEKHAGHYKCTARNAVGASEHTTTLIIQVPPKIISSFAVYKGIEDKDALLRIPCETTGLPKPVITWKVNEIAIIQNEKYSIKDGALIIKNPKVSDSQTYKCEATNVVGSAAVVFKAKVLQEPRITGVTEMTVDAGTEAKIECKFTKGVPKPTISWEYMSEVDTTFMQIPSTDNVLQLSEVDEQYAGRYKCIVTNEAGTAEHVTLLIVKSTAPVITSDTTKTYKGLEGDVALRIPCDVVAIPPPTIKWKIGGTIIIPNKRYSIVNGSLVIKNPKKDDTKTYVCEASNSIGTVEKKFEVEVDTSLDDYGNLEEVHVLLGTTKKLECSMHDTKDMKCVTDDPNQSVRWFMEGVDIEISENIFTIENAEFAQDGNYTCRVSNIKCTQTKTFVVVVGTPPVFSFEQEDTSFDWDGSENEYDMLDCQVNAKPFVDVVWTYNGKVLSGQESQLLPISGNWGHYTCNISNPHGFVQKTFNVTSSKCLIKRKPENVVTMPLILNQESTWLTGDATEGYLKVLPGESIILSCPSQKGGVNALQAFPTINEVKANCVKQDMFSIKDKLFKVSDLHCAQKVNAVVVDKKEKCLNEHSKLMRVGYDVHGFLETYEVCFDTLKNIPLYTRVLMSKTNRGPAVSYDWYKYPGIGDGKSEGRYTCEGTTRSCCYSKTQLVNARDFSDGPAQRSTYIESLNAIPYFGPCDEKKDMWSKLEDMVRSQLSSYNQFITWSGTHKLQEKNGQIIPRYLWKVVRFDEDDSIAIVYINDEKPLPEDILCENKCVDDNVAWLRDLDAHTYCCDVNEFLQAFNLMSTTIGESQEESIDQIVKY